MPLHDWSNVADGLFHDFLHGWTSYLSRAINGRVDEQKYYALLDRDLDAVLDAKAGLYSEMETHIALRPSIVVRLCANDMPVARLEIVSPGLKRNMDRFRDFVAQFESSIRGGVHVLYVDLFPPVALGKDGLPRLATDFIASDWVSRDPLSVSYRADRPVTWVTSPTAFGAEMRSMPLHLTAGESVEVPLEETYRAAWDGLAGVVRKTVSTHSRQ